jgi:Leucine-rich repeat (LRR) protein
MPSSDKNGLTEAERRIAEATHTGETALNLSDLGLQVLPEGVCRLAHLRFLYANNNRLTQLPESIGQLAQLQELTLVGNQLTQLPVTIGQCARLRKLYLDDNRLMRLPESIGRLVRLQKLSLLGNGLTHLPRCVGHLAQLESLRLSHNRLAQLPKWIGQLAQLKRFYLNSNRLARLPESIGQLAQLEELYLRRNRLTDLPENIRQLARLRKLCLHGNEALNIPAEELGPSRREIGEKKGSRKPPHEVLDYYFRTRITGKSEQGEVKTSGNAVTPRLLKLSGESIKRNKKTICFVVVYFGKWPVWFPAFLHSCAKNPTINWIFFTDCHSPAHHSANVMFYNKTLGEMRKLIKKKVGKEAMLEDFYKIPDYKPAFGILFDDYLNDFDFWGHCDIDIIWGDIRKYTTDEILDKYDIFSTRKEMISGHFSLFKNTPSVNRLFRQSSEFAEVMRQVDCRAFDEEGMTRLIEQLARAGSIRVYWPRFLQNYAYPKTDTPSKLPRYINKYFWKKGKLFDCTGESAAEILYLHFMTWKKTLIDCEFGYRADPEKFYISYSKISMQPISRSKEVHRRA